MWLLYDLQDGLLFHCHSDLLSTIISLGGIIAYGAFSCRLIQMQMFAEG